MWYLINGLIIVTAAFVSSYTGALLGELSTITPVTQGITIGTTSAGLVIYTINLVRNW